nr:hypothetical protein [Candidatus Sigynarchaeota archaeon]
MVQIGDFNFPEDRYYSTDHIWVKVEADNKVALMGIDAMGFTIAGNISMIRVKKGNKPVATGRAFGTMESGKGVVPLKSPVTGTILDVNPLLEEKNFQAFIDNPFDNWLVKIQMENAGELGGLFKKTADIAKWAKEELAKIK